jgi:tRNA(Ile)-lysidine synthase
LPGSRHKTFEAAVRDTIRRRHLFAPGARILVAVSGGPDSTALLAALSALRDAGSLSGVWACHVDHQLRPESRLDGEHCEALCASLAVPLQRISVTVSPSGSVQAAARRARYRALRMAADACGAEWIATGHTRSDQAETVLHRLLRGSGARGLAGIPPRRGRIVRPILDRSRGEVLDYLRERHLKWREDPSNASPRFLRNRIRREVVPALEALAPGIERRLARTADLLREDDRALERMAAHALERGAVSAATSALRALPLAARRRAVRRLWRSATGARRDLGVEHVEWIVRSLGQRRPIRLALPRGLEARVAYGRVEIGRAAEPAVGFEPVVVAGPGLYAIPGRSEAVEVGWSSAERPPWPLELRTRRPGDRFHPAHAPGGKKLKAWLIDRKIPRAARDALLLVADGRGRVLAIPDLGSVARGALALEVVVHRGAARSGERAPALQPAAPPVIRSSRVRR